MAVRIPIVVALFCDTNLYLLLVHRGAYNTRCHSAAGDIDARSANNQRSPSAAFLPEDP
jgi:hypothetical protein